MAGEDTSVIGLVLAREGSKGIIGKNMALLDGKPLLHRCLEIMKEAKCFNSIWVSTNDISVAECAKNCGVEVHERAEYTATDEASSLSGIQEFLQNHTEISLVCLVQCTSPFLRPEYLVSGVNKIKDDHLDSVFSVTRRHLLRWSEDNPTQALNFDPSHRPRRQDWNGELYENGMFYISRSELVKTGAIQGKSCGYVEIPVEDSMEIDTPIDLVIAQAIIFQKAPSKADKWKETSL